jgi:hypothetical protein
MPGRSGVTVVTNSRVFFYTRGCGRIERPAFPAPSDFQERYFFSAARAPSRRGARMCVWFAVIARSTCDEAIHLSLLAAPKLDCFASITMTTKNCRGCLKI